MGAGRACAELVPPADACGSTRPVGWAHVGWGQVFDPNFSGRYVPYCPCTASHPTSPAALDEAQEAIQKLEGDIRSIKGQMAELKTVLYAKFGNSVSVE